MEERDKYLQNLEETASERNSRLAREFSRFRSDDKDGQNKWENEDIAVWIGTVTEESSLIYGAISEAGIEGDWVEVVPGTSQSEMNRGNFRLFEYKGFRLPEKFVGRNGLVHTMWAEYYLKEEGGLAFKATFIVSDENSKPEDYSPQPDKIDEIAIEYSPQMLSENMEIKSLNPNDYEYLGSILTTLKKGSLKGS